MWSRLNSYYDALPALGQFSAVPAAMIDETYLQDSSWLWKECKVRAIYGLLFAPAVAVDAAVSLTLGLRYAAGTFFTSDDIQGQLFAQQKKYATLFSKNLIGMFVLPVGFIVGPHLVEVHFLPDKAVKGIKSGGGHYHAPNVTVHHPESIQALQAIVRRAAERKQKLMPVGAGFSQGRQFIPEGEPGQECVVVDLRHLNTIQIHAENQTAVVGAGVRWSDLQLHADKHRLAIQTMQASNVFSVGGAIGINAHGWNIRSGPLANTILSMDIINAQGERETLTPDNPLFHHVTGGLGLFGTVVSARIQLTQNRLLQEKGTRVRLSDYVRHFRERVLPNDKVPMHLYRLSLDPSDLLAEGIAVDYEIVGDGQAVRTPDLTPESARGTRFNRIFVNLANKVGQVRKLYWDQESDRLLTPDLPPMTTNAIMQPFINAMFTASKSEAEWLQEYFLPEESLQAFVEALARLLSENKVALLNASVRFVKKHNQSPLSYAHDGDRFAVVLCFNQSLHPDKVVQAEKWLRQAQALSVRHGGAFYLPYQHVVDPAVFHAAYPHAQAAMEMKRKVDPDNLFASGFYQKYLAPQPTRVNHFVEIMKSDESRKQFKGFLENVLQRVESGKVYALLLDVMEYKDSHAEIYAELSRRIAEIAPDQLQTMRRILNSLEAIKKDLGEQAKILLSGTKVIDGLVEIGYPGRFIAGFKQDFTVTGKVVVVNESEALSDHIQTGSLRRPYQQFAKLDYSNPDMHQLPDNSADVMTCYVGLHHFPENKLQYFLQEIRRVLRPGGRFLLVDHDVVDDNAMTMAWGAHMFYNAVMGVPLEDEMNERRHFRSMADWCRLLEEAGLGYSAVGSDVPLIREGDPSRNRMVCFTNQPKLELTHAARVTSLDDEQTLRRRTQVSVASSREALFSEAAAGAPSVAPAPAGAEETRRVKRQ